MTDVRAGGLAREALIASVGEARLGGMAREVLIQGVIPTQIWVGGLAREVLLTTAAPTPPGLSWGYAVSIIT